MRSFISIIQFLFSFSKKVSKSSTSFTFVVFLGLFSQIFLVASFIIPIKVIVTLYNNKVPAYINSNFEGLSVDIFVLILSFSAIASYFVNLFLSKNKNSLISTESFKIAERAGNKKKAILEKDFSEKIYELIARLWTNLFLIIVYVVLLLFLVTRLGLFLIFAIVVTQIYVIKKSTQYFSNVDIRLSELNKSIVDACNLGFISCFLFFASSLYFLQFGSLENSHLLLYIISLIVCRQIFQRLSVANKDLIYSEENKFKISELFYANPTAIRSLKERQTVKAVDFNVYKLPQLIEDNLSSYFGKKINLRFYDLPVKNVVFFKSGGVSTDFDIYVKIFEKPLSQSSTAEFEILFSSVSRSVIPVPIYSFSIDGLKVLILKTPKISHQSIPHRDVAVCARVKSYCLEISHEDKLIFEKEHQDLPSRLTSHDLRYLELVSHTDRDKEIVESFKIDMVDIVEFLRKVPKSIINFELDNKSLLNTVGSPTFLNFNKVRYDLIFSDIKYEKEDHLYDLKSLECFGFNNSCNFTDIDIKRIIVISEFERAFTGRLYERSLELIYSYYEIVSGSH